MILREILVGVIESLLCYTSNDSVSCVSVFVWCRYCFPLSVVDLQITELTKNDFHFYPMIVNCQWFLGLMIDGQMCFMSL